MLEILSRQCLEDIQYRIDKIGNETTLELPKQGARVIGAMLSFQYYWTPLWNTGIKCVIWFFYFNYCVFLICISHFTVLWRFESRSLVIQLSYAITIKHTSETSLIKADETTEFDQQNLQFSSSLKNAKSPTTSLQMPQPINLISLWDGCG